MGPKVLRNSGRYGSQPGAIPGPRPAVPVSPVSNLARLLSRSDLGKADDREGFLREAVVIFDLLDRPEEQRARGYLRVAMLLTQMVEGAPIQEARAIDATVRRLVSWAAKGGKTAPTPQAPVAPALPAAATEEYQRLGEEVDRSVGSILVRMGEVSEQDVKRAEKKRAEGEMLGETLVRSGDAQDSAVGEAVRLQTNLVRQSALEIETSKVVDEWCLGEVLVRLTWIDRPTLEKALRLQRASGLRLGETLIQMGAMTKFQINDALRIQKRERQRREG